MIHTATWEEIAELIKQDRKDAGEVQKIYIKDGMVHVETAGDCVAE